MPILVQGVLKNTILVQGVLKNTILVQGVKNLNFGTGKKTGGPSKIVETMGINGPVLRY